MEVWPQPAQLHQGIRVCTAVPGKKKADPELDCGGVARAGQRVPVCVLLYLAKRRRIRSRIVEVWPLPAQLHQGIRVCTALPGKRAADLALDFAVWPELAQMRQGT